MLQRRHVLSFWACAAWGITAPTTANAADAPALLLAHVYRPGLRLQDYWVSEKFDGVRGYWDGQRLRTRGGEPVHAPAWFTAGWPATPQDGELWAGRARAQKLLDALSFPQSIQLVGPPGIDRLCFFHRGGGSPAEAAKA